MAKMFYAAVAVLCTLAAVGGVPIEGETSQQLLALAAKSTLGGKHANILDFISKAQASSIDDAVSAIIEQEIQDKLGPIIEEQAQDLEEAVQGGLGFLDTSACSPLRDEDISQVQMKIFDNMTQCVNNGKQSLIQVVQQFRDQLPQTKTAIQEAVNEVNECRSQGSRITKTTCLETKLPAIRTKLEELTRRAVDRSASVTARVGSILSEVETCTQSALSAGRAELKQADFRARSCIDDSSFLFSGITKFLGISLNS